MQGRLRDLRSYSSYGLDLSLTATGVAKYDHHKEHFEGWLIRSQPPGFRRPYEHIERLIKIRDRVLRVIPDRVLVVVEAPAYRSQVGLHERSGVWWMVVAGLLEKRCEIVEVAPATRAKYVTGNGRADKKAVVKAVNSLYRLPNPVTDDNLADAVTLSAMGLRLMGVPVERVRSKRSAEFEERLQVVRRGL
ncbi:hypothetical protein EII30_08565 [Leucobacter sp. OH1287]|nr:hypothetical protein EII30_08565 [Leucobacter sp. OH1287]